MHNDLQRSHVNQLTEIQREETLNILTVLVDATKKTAEKTLTVTLTSLTHGVLYSLSVQARKSRVEVARQATAAAAVG